MSKTSLYEFVKFVKASHAAVEHLRRYTSEPYEIHLAEVAAYAAVIHEEYADQVPLHVFQAVAWGHDLKEDTNCTDIDIIRVLKDSGWSGVDIMQTVMGIDILTDPPKEDGINRARRIEMQCFGLSFAPDWVQALKCIDIFSNVKSLAVHDPEFCATFLMEKEGYQFFKDPDKHKLIKPILQDLVESTKTVLAKQVKCRECGSGVLVYREKDVVYEHTDAMRYFRGLHGFHCTCCTSVVLDEHNLGPQEKRIIKASLSLVNDNILISRSYFNELKGVK
jgi:guanosine-3',5'-bis(diphosphate) 3'-pyrophosphohydrolase